MKRTIDTTARDQAARPPKTVGKQPTCLTCRRLVHPSVTHCPDCAADWRLLVSR